MSPPLTQHPGLTINTRPGQHPCFDEPLGEGLTLRMMQIPAGSFTMGSPGDELERLKSEGPQHPVSVPSFFFGKYPVTQAQWRFVAGLEQVNRALESFPSLFNFKGDDRPVETVSWYEAIEFCNRLSRYTQRDYRLPTEAEWEYACRAGTDTPFHFGETITTDLANYCGQDDNDEPEKYPGNYGNGPKGEYREETTPVDYFGLANGWGLCDIHGNVWEWCQDYWHDSYNDAPTEATAWLTGNQEANRVIRGGSWYGYPMYCRSAYRGIGDPNLRFDDVGFRVVCIAP